MAQPSRAPARGKLATDLTRGLGIAMFSFATLCVGACVGVCIGICIPSPVAAQTQLRLDGTLPGGRTDDLVLTQPGPIYTLDESMGAARGNNLFHSFADFSIGAGDTADFTSVQPFDRVIARVTGGNASTINGTLRSSVQDAMGGGADLFLLNPAGILFGANSAIDVSGSLFLSSADTLQFENGDVFETFGPAPPILSIASPESFGFRGGGAAADITFIENGTGGFGFLSLGVPEGETLAAIGGDIRAAGPTGFLSLQTPGGTLALVATGSAAAAVAVETFDLSTSEPGLLGTISLETGASLSGIDLPDPDEDQGMLVIRGGRLEVLGADVTFGGNASTNSPALDIDLADTLRVGDFGFISAVSRGSTQGADARITAPTIEIDGTGSGIFIQSTGAGGGGILIIEATDLTIENGGRISTITETVFGATGAGGTLLINAENISLRSAGRIESASNSEAPGGTLTLNAARILIEDEGLIVSSNASGAEGNLVRIQADELIVRDAGRIETSTTGTGTGSAIQIFGSRIEVTRTEDAAIAGLINSTSALNAIGTGGEVEINVDSIDLSSGGQIATSALGGDAGRIFIDAMGEFRLRGDNGAAAPSGVFSRALNAGMELGRGAAGDIIIEADTVLVEDGAFVSAFSETVANAGDISISASDRIAVTGFGSFGSTLSTRATLAGAGAIALDAPKIEISGGSGLDLSSLGSEPSGQLTITGGNLIVEGTSPNGLQPSSLSARTSGSGDARGVEIRLTGDLVVRDGARITSSSSGGGAAGDIVIQSLNVRIEDGASLLAEATGAAGADAGHITIEADESIRISSSAIETESRPGAGAGGQISLSAADQINVRRSAITTEAASGEGNGGDLELSAGQIILSNSALVARAVGGDGGNIVLSADPLLQSGDTVLDASSQIGINGQIISATPAADLSGQLGRPEASPSDPADRLARACDTRSEIVGSLIVQTARPERRFDADDLLRRPSSADDAGPSDPSLPASGGDACVR